jgi:putative copper export protein
MPTWALALAYAFHLMATVVWVGGLALLALVVWPAARSRLGPGPEAGRFLGDVQRRFNPLAWLSLAVLVGTGLMQMTADPNYAGFLQLDSPWAVAILVKHLAVGGMVAAGAATQWWVQPEIVRLSLLAERGRPSPQRPAPGAERRGGEWGAELAALRRREAALLWANLAGALITLVCTAVATAQP